MRDFYAFIFVIFLGILGKFSFGNILKAFHNADYFLLCIQERP